MNGISIYAIPGYNVKDFPEDSVQPVQTEQPEPDFKTMKDIHLAVSRVFGIHPQIIRWRTRKPEILIPRQVAMTLAWGYFPENSSFTLAKIGEYFGGFDHATVINAINRVSDLFETDKYFRNKIKHLFRDIDSSRFPAIKKFRRN